MSNDLAPEAAAFRAQWHRQHIEQGLCPAISTHRAWCTRPDGHDGSHGTPRIAYPDAPVSPTNPTWVDWDQ